MMVPWRLVLLCAFTKGAAASAELMKCLRFIVNSMGQSAVSRRIFLWVIIFILIIVFEIKVFVEIILFVVV